MAESLNARLKALLKEKDERILTPTEQAALIALANVEFDDAILLAKKRVQKNHPELFDKKTQLRKRKALASLQPTS